MSRARDAAAEPDRLAPGEQLLDDAAPVGDLAAPLPATLIPGGLQLLQADRGSRQLVTDRLAHERPVMKDTDLGEIAGKYGPPYQSEADRDNEDSPIRQASRPNTDARSVVKQPEDAGSSGARTISVPIPPNEANVVCSLLQENSVIARRTAAAAVGGH